MDAPRAPFELARVCRLSVRKGRAPDVGSFVELKARLQPAPLRHCGPGGHYDFGRDMFSRVSRRVGFRYRLHQGRGACGEGRPSLRYAAFMQGLRDHLCTDPDDA